MAVHVEGNNASYEAGADLSAKIYHLVKLNTSNQVVLCSAATDPILGVLMNAPEAGESADVALVNGNGTGKVKLGDNVSKDARLTSDSSGQAVATTTVGDYVFGRALLAGSDGDVHEYQKENSRYAATA